MLKKLACSRVGVQTPWISAISALNVASLAVLGLTAPSRAGA